MILSSPRVLRLRPMRIFLAAVLLLPSAARCALQVQKPERLVFVHKGKPRGLRFEGRPWVTDEAKPPSQRGYRGQGEGNGLFARQTPSNGDFEIRARLILEKLPGSEAAFLLGRNRIGFASKKDRRGKSVPFLEGALFRGKAKTPGKKTAARWLLPEAAELITEGESFELRIVREEGTLQLFFGEDVVHEQLVHEAPFPRIGFDPGRAIVRLMEFELIGKREAAKLFDASDVLRLRKRIDRAIDRGVEFLLNTQERDGSWAYSMERYRNGQTALSVYTLLKCGVPKSDPAIRRALAYLSQEPARETYSAAVTLLALQTTHDPKHEKVMGDLLRFLLRWQKGSWGYPWSYSMKDWHRVRGRPDLSNTQYAALGLWACQRAGLPVPKKAWSALLRATLSYQVGPVNLTVPRPIEGTGTGQRQVAGFGYTANTGARASGSMTCAGIAILALCRKGLGDRITIKERARIDRGIEGGVAFLDHWFSVRANYPTSSWIYYYLYGLERVGGLLETPYIGEHHWYYQGAKFLLAKQQTDGHWAQYYAAPDTCFALLFLKRATAPATGAQEPLQRKVWKAEQANTDVRLRGTGQPMHSIWITGFGAQAKDKFGEDGAGPRVLRVEYLLDGKVVAKVAGNPKRAWAKDSLAAQFKIDGRGKHKVSARVFVLDPLADPLSKDAEVAIESKGYVVHVKRTYPAWMIDYAQSRSRNLVEGHVASIEVSSSEGASFAANRAVDNLPATAWLCKKDDKAPTLRLRLMKRRRANRIVLCQAAGSELKRHYFDAIRKASVRINRKQVLRVEFPEDVLEPLILDLGRPTQIQTIELRILERRSKGKRYPGRVGLAELGLELRR